MDRSEALGHLRTARVGHLGTTKPDGRPHVVPVTFALTGSRVATMVDHKPKSTLRLQRLQNIEASGRATLLVDHYADDWSELWWVRVDGPASVHFSGADWEAARDSLSDKYDQYKDLIPSGPAIILEIEEVSYWESTP